MRENIHALRRGRNQPFSRVPRRLRFQRWRLGSILRACGETSPPSP